MFTGLIEEIGKMISWQRTPHGHELTIQTTKNFLLNAQLGDSISVNGACLTITQLKSNAFTVGVSTETKERTNLLTLKKADSIHLERAVTPTTRMGGHFVQGHIDAVGTLIDRKVNVESIWLTISATPELLRYIVPKGFIALDGTSLTVVDVTTTYFTIMLIPYTQKIILLSEKKLGALINIEVDILGKYVEKLMNQPSSSPTSNLSEQFLRNHGY